MVVGEVAEGVDLLVVGGGPGGYTAALRAAQLGRQVVLVDRNGESGVGGVCLRVGCIPSKALIEAANLVFGLSEGAKRGILSDSHRFDMGIHQEWKNARVDDLTGGVKGLLDAAGVRIVRGIFRFTRPGSGVVQLKEGPPLHLEYMDVVLASGSRPIELPGLPFNGVDVIDSTEALALDKVPKTVAVVGGGYIGIELGTALAKLGSTVTVVELSDRILPTVDAGLVRPVEKRLKEIGVNVMVKTTALSFKGGELSVEGPGGPSHVKAEKAIVAVGRRPNTDELGLQTIGITPGDGGLLDVAPDRRISDHVAAIGDITPGPALAHKASAEALVAVEALCGKRVAFDPAAIPIVVYSDPEIASAGLTIESASAAGLQAEQARFPLSASGRAATIGARDGYLQLVIDRDANAVVGVHIVAPHASELIAEGILAIEMGVSPEDLAASIHPHPTFSEIMAEAAHVAVGTPIHVAKKLRGRMQV